MYVALANFAYSGQTCFVGDEIHFVKPMLKNGLIGYSEEIEEDEGIGFFLSQAGDDAYGAGIY